MSNQTKKKSFNWARAWKKFKVLLIFAVAVFAFAIMGMFQGSDLSGGGFAAQVNDEIITLRDYSEYLERLQNQMGD